MDIDSEGSRKAIDQVLERVLLDIAAEQSVEDMHMAMIEEQKREESSACVQRLPQCVREHAM